MNIQIPFRLTLLTAALVLALGQVCVQAADGMVGARHAVRLESVNALVAALKRQNASKGGGREAEIVRIEAGLGEVRQLNATGRTDEAEKRVEELYQQTRSAIASMQKASGVKTGGAALEASQRAAALEVDTPRLRSTFTQRESSMVALLAAGNRAATDRGMSSAELAEAEQQLAAAREQARAGQYPSAIALLEQGWQQVKLAVRELRQGQELVADKNFASPAEEYRYEQTRNDDYRKLITGLLPKATDASWSASAGKSRRLRAEAERAAAARHWETALSQIELSTQALKSILKLAGFPIM